MEDWPPILGFKIVAFRAGENGTWLRPEVKFQ